MRFTLYTLVDITETNTRRGEDPLKYRQQQNYLTVIQTIGMRVNPIYVNPPVIIKEIPSKLGLGSKYNTKESIWKYTFDIEYEGGLSLEILENDFDLVPVITNLEETAKFDNSHFITKKPNKNNIIFQIVDK